MNTSPSRQAKHAFHPQRLPYHKKEHSQTTIDLYLKPIAKVAPGQSDIRNYFTPVAKTKSSPDGELTKSDSLKKIQATTQPSQSGNGAAKCRSLGFSPSAKKAPVETTESILKTAAHPTKPAPLTPRNHKHANSAVLPNFDPFFDNNGDDFPHSVSPMAHRATDVYARHSLIPKPLNIRMPPPSPAELSETTSSPSSIDTASSSSLDDNEERQRHEAQSFKRTYKGVHDSRHHRTSENPDGSPLMALRDRSRGTLGGGSSRPVERPAALRAKTMPQMEERRYGGNDNSVIYFLPKISPTEESEVEDVEGRGARRGRFEEGVMRGREGVMRGREGVMRGREDGRRGGKFDKVGEVQMERRRDAVGQKDTGVSPGLQRYYDYLASQRNGVSTRDRTKDRKTFIGSGEEEETPLLDRTDSGLSGKREKKENKKKEKKKGKGKGFLRLIEAYSKHVEGLQMIQ